jgi:hypothetical protein
MAACYWCGLQTPAVTERECVTCDRLAWRFDFWRSDADRAVVRRSTIPNSGRGLFAATRVLRDETVAVFGGYLTRRTPLVTTHTLQVTKTLFIDGNPTLQPAKRRRWRPGVAQFVQSSDSRHPGNSRFVVNRRARTVRLVATRRIEMGDEVFARYC